MLLAELCLKKIEYLLAGRRRYGFGVDTVLEEELSVIYKLSEELVVQF